MMAGFGIVFVGMEMIFEFGDELGAFGTGCVFPFFNIYFAFQFR